MRKNRFREIKLMGNKKITKIAAAVICLILVLALLMGTVLPVIGFLLG